MWFLIYGCYNIKSIFVIENLMLLLGNNKFYNEFLKKHHWALKGSWNSKDVGPSCWA